jgi:DNA-binding MarR family transcriptional regulator
VSIETRKQKGESYSTYAGFFRRYELYYVVADERDVIRVRTTYRQPQEDVYIYRVRAPQRNIRRSFLDYIRAINDMHSRPRFYNTLTTNCTTSILMHTRMNPESPPMSWKVLLSGYVPDYLYELGRIDTAKPFANLEKLSRVNERASGPTLRAAHTALFPHLNAEGVRGADLAKKLGVTKQAVSQLVTELEEWGVVDQIADPQDGRAKLVRFTKKGEQGMLHGLAVLGEIETELTNKIGKRRMQDLHTALLAVEAALSEER